MRVESWNPNTADASFEDVSIDRLVAGANVLRAVIRRRLAPSSHGISRPVYRKGRYAGKNWTAREAGSLRKSARVVRKLSKSGKPLAKKRNVRVYVGNYLAYYADVFEANHPFLRPAVDEAMPMIKTAIGVKTNG